MKDRIENQVLQGEARDTLRQLPSNSIDLIVTSPPYFGQRDYGDKRQLGTEESPAEYVCRLVKIFAEARRVLRSQGTCWVVIGDKYIRGSLLGIPWRTAIGMQDDGWYLRSDVIWHKPNAMPSAAKRRPTVDHEYVFMFSKAQDYFYDADAIREPHVTFSSQSKMRGGRKHFGVRGGTPEAGKNGGAINLHDARWDQAFHPKGRNKRTVWSISLSKSRAEHFAVFPEKLVENCIAAGSKPGDLVLDPFCGTGTTLAVADRMKRRFLGIDCVADYCRLSRERVGWQEDSRSQ